jgi:hypothetical protein
MFFSKDPAQVGMALDADAHHVPGLALVPVGRRPYGDDARHRLAFVEPHLNPHASGGRHREQVVIHREALRLRVRQLLQALRARSVQVAPVLRADVAGDAGATPTEVIGRRDVGEEVEPLLVAQVRAGLDQPGGIDHERRLAVRLARLDEPRDGLEAQLATPRIS